MGLNVLRSDARSALTRRRAPLPRAAPRRVTMPYCHACHLLQPARAQITSSLLVWKRYYEDGREDLENWWHVEWHDAAYVHSNHVEIILFVNVRHLWRRR